ncbi:MAG: hypothetical protein IPP29_04835 [Bacteroidetes bacterium]|nr:hypothetical protein [Bacteroidota bacterium]
MDRKNAEFEYTIHFQNTGTDTAINVNIYDVIDPAFQFTSLKVLASSHSHVDSLGLGLVNFKFENIYLPDSNVNELLSHGWIKYYIKPK